MLITQGVWLPQRELGLHLVFVLLVGGTCSLSKGSRCFGGSWDPTLSFWEGGAYLRRLLRRDLALHPVCALLDS